MFQCSDLNKICSGSSLVSVFFFLQEGVSAHQEGLWLFLWLSDRKCGSLQVKMNLPIIDRQIEALLIPAWDICESILINMNVLCVLTLPVCVSHIFICPQLRVLRWPRGLWVWSPWWGGCGVGPGREILHHTLHTESSQDPGEPWPRRQAAVPAALPPGITPRLDVKTS